MAEPPKDQAGQTPEASAAEPAGPGVDEPTPDLEAELAETKDKLLRALAEQQNIRRLMQRERDEAVKFAASKLAEDLLETLDNLRRAIESAAATESGEAEMKQLVAGVEVTERNLMAALERHGVRKIEPLGEVFDPNLHQAVFQRPDDEEGKIIEVLQPGYIMHERLLRPAMVGVAAARDE
ncbi:nucleotide exchange factor GrpE [Mesorhizobium sp. ANAO-SY3R2]|uniref:nucleotide exchange factor GrpE n=1 Tax=Mesorhizobium sp. ANAO-SY3R2 TaxID=3166644 RepID=UPI00366D575D